MNKVPDYYYKVERTELVPFLPTQYNKVLEVGCAEGDFSRHLNAGCEIWGCEPDSKAAKAASGKLSKILFGKYEQVVHDIPNDYFDLIICNDVIEHMADHDWFFDSISTKLQPDGYIVGSVPNVRHIRNLYRLLILKDWHYQDSLTLDRTHLRFFTARSFRRTLTAHTYIVEELKGINTTTHIMNKILFIFLNCITLGLQSDVKYLQFAFRARKKNLTNPPLDFVGHKTDSR